METTRKQKRRALYGTDIVAFRRVCGKIERRTFQPSDCVPGMTITMLRPQLQYSYEICDPTRDPTKPGSLQERMRADRVFKEVIAKVNEQYALMRP